MNQKLADELLPKLQSYEGYFGSTNLDSAVQMRAIGIVERYSAGNVTAAHRILDTVGMDVVESLLGGNEPSYSDFEQEVKGAA